MARIGSVIHTKLSELLFTPEDRARLNALGEVVWTDSAEPMTTEAACRLLADCDIGVGSWKTPTPNAELLAACPKLRLWEHVAGTVKHFFGPHLSERDLTIASCKTAIADSVAEMVLGEIILGARRVFENAAANRFGPTGNPGSMKTLYGGATIGIVGASEVGKRVMKLLRPFGCSLRLYDPFATQELAAEYGATLEPDLLALCADCDVVSLHTPDLPTTKHLFSAAQFQAMQDDAIFINSSRGACVDEAALIAELEKGRLFAFLDVSAPEPAPPDSPLRRLPNVVYTSHIAGPPAYNLGRQAVDDIAAYLRGESPLCIVRAEELERIA